MCGRIGCIFTRFQPRKNSGQDGCIRLLVIGASGMTGSAVMDAAVACVWFKVAAFTRNPKNLQDNAHVKRGNVSLVVGDMLEIATVKKAMEDIDVVFFSTAYWDTRDTECEYQQGRNVVNAAYTARIKHILYVGTKYRDAEADAKCNFLVAKEKVQKLVMDSGVPWTILHLGFYYENFVSIFRPHIVDTHSFALALPMGNTPINCGSIMDFAHCVAQIILRPTSHIGQVITLATGYHTVTQFVAWMDKKFPDYTIFDPKISIEEYKSLKYEGSEEIYGLFKFRLSENASPKQDQKIAFDLCPTARSFSCWLDETESAIMTCFSEQMEERGIGQLKSHQAVDILSTYSLTLEFANVANERKKKLKTNEDFLRLEEEKNFERRATLCDNMQVFSGFRSLWNSLMESDG